MIQQTLKYYLQTILLICLSTIFVFSISANPFKRFWQKTKGNYFVNVEVGQVSGKMNETSRAVKIANYPWQWTLDNYNQNAFDYGINGGLITQFTPKFNVLWGIGLYQTTARTVTGRINTAYPGQVPSYNYNYSYRFSATRLMASIEARYRIKHFYPYFKLGTGYGLLKSSNYRSIELGTGAPELLPFANKTVGQSISQIGVGVDYQVAKNWLFGFDYSLLSMRGGQLGVMPGQSTDQHLSTGDIDLQRIALKVSHQF